MYVQYYNHLAQQIPDNSKAENPDSQTDASFSVDDDNAIRIQGLLKLDKPDKSVQEIEQSLTAGNLYLSEDLVLNVLKRHRSDWEPAYMFFRWLTKGKSCNGYFPDTDIYNEMFDILGRMHRFDELSKLLDEMSKRKILISERTYRILINRYSAAHKIEEAIELFHKRKDLGVQLDLVAFQTLLFSLCRYKHVEDAEVLFNNKKSEFEDDIKTRNIILNGWCILGNLREAKRFWKDIVSSNCKPDKYTYGIFINSLNKAGKISTAVKLFQAMWEKGCKPDVAICNSIIDGLCFKKRIPEALEIFQEMNDKGCSANVATYNSLIKHLLKIKKIDKVHELLDEMKMKGEVCKPNAITYGYLLNYSRTPEEVYDVLDRMERNGFMFVSDTYNLLLRLFMNWGKKKQAEAIWHEMQKSGLGPDRRSYTIMINGLINKEMKEEALGYFQEMTSKGMVPEPRTKLLVEAIDIKLSKGGSLKIPNEKGSKKSQ